MNCSHEHHFENLVLWLLNKAQLNNYPWLWPKRPAMETSVERCSVLDAGELRTLQKKRTAVADQLFFLRAQKIRRKLQSRKRDELGMARRSKREGWPFGSWKVKSLLSTNAPKIKGGSECVYRVCPWRVWVQGIRQRGQELISTPFQRC